MNADGWARLWSLVVDRADGRPVAIHHVGAAMVAAAGVDGVSAAVTLSSSPRETIYASDRVAADLAELTVTLGEGPGVDAFAGRLTLAADLTTAGQLARWPVFAPAAASAGVRAVFALPLQVGGIRLGAVCLHRAREGAPGRDQLADALALTDTICALLLDAGGDGAWGDGAWGDGAWGDSRRGEGVPDTGRHLPEQASPQHPEVHQATGMLTVQLAATAAVALVRLRAYAYAHDRRLRDVAADVVARRLRFTAGIEGEDDD